MAAYSAASERLWLQPLDVVEHLQDYFEIMSSPGSMFWSWVLLPIPFTTTNNWIVRRSAPHRDVEETRVLMLDSLPTPEKPWNRRWAIMLKPCTNSGNDSPLSQGKPKMIGIVGTPRKAELAYKIHPDYWGKGYMTETLTMFLTLFWESEENKGSTRLIAGADPENGASTKVLEKAGFQRGELKKDFYERGAGIGKKSNIQFFYLQKPSGKPVQNLV